MSDTLKTHKHDDVRTVFNAVRRGARISKNGPMLGYRDGVGSYQWMLYSDVR